MINNPSQFVNALFDNLPKGAHPVVCGFTNDPKNAGQWHPIVLSSKFPKPLNKAMNLYVGVSSVYNLSEKKGYSASGAAALHFMMIDDVTSAKKGTLPLDPTYIIESSPNNYQYIYKLINPVTDRVYATRLCNALADKAGGDTSSKGMVRWARMPYGTNTKSKYNKPRTKLKDQSLSWVSYSVEDIIEAFDLKVEPTEDAEASSQLELEEIDALLEVIDPDGTYDEWNTVMTAVNAAGGTYEQVVEWSQRGSSYDPKALTKAKWDSYTPDYTNGITARTLVKLAIDSGWEGNLNLAVIEEFPSAEIQSVELLDPIEPETYTKADKFPTALLSAPTKIAQAILDYTISNSTRPQPILALGTMLSVLSAATKNLYQTPTGLRGNLYLVLVGRTSSGKNAPLRAATEILTGSMANSIVSRLASGAALHKKLVNQGNLLVSTDEIGLWLSSVMHSDASPHSRQIVDIMMECFTAADHIFFGKAYADSKNDLEDINNPFLTVIGATTASALFEAVEEKDIHSGMFNRFLFLQSEDMPDKVFTPKQQIPQPLKDWVASMENGVTDFKNFYTPDNPYTVPIDEPALETLLQFSNKAEEHIRKSELEAALWGRADEQAHKIAMLLAVSKDKDKPVVTKELAVWSTAFMRHQIKYMSETIAKNATAGKFEEGAMKLLEVIKQAKTYKFTRGHHQEFLDRGYITRTVLARKSKVKGASLDETLKDLIEAEYVGVDMVKGKAKMDCKPTKVFWAL